MKENCYDKVVLERKLKEARQELKDTQEFIRQLLIKTTRRCQNAKEMVV